ncbi:MAG: hypothetical protein MJZ20_02915 [Bacteroidaceae bacterium]|nr:hypothetical protein [Bacteroidaceae bacterium]
MSTKNALLRKEQNRRAYLRRLARAGINPLHTPATTYAMDERITYEIALAKLGKIAMDKYNLSKEQVIQGIMLCMKYGMAK